MLPYRDGGVDQWPLTLRVVRERRLLSAWKIQQNETGRTRSVAQQEPVRDSRCREPRLSGATDGLALIMWHSQHSHSDREADL